MQTLRRLVLGAGDAFRAPSCMRVPVREAGLDHASSARGNKGNTSAHRRSLLMVGGMLVPLVRIVWHAAKRTKMKVSTRHCLQATFHPLYSTYYTRVKPAGTKATPRYTVHAAPGQSHDTCVCTLIHTCWRFS